jgi:hypothetical protein
MEDELDISMGHWWRDRVRENLKYLEKPVTGTFSTRVIFCAAL